MSRPSRAAVLVADDDYAIRDLLRSMLTGEGYAVECAASGDKALGLMTPGRFAGVVLDITMPGMSGFDVLHRLRQLNRPEPVMVMSARHSPDDVRKAIGLGAKDYVAKPFTNAQLVTRLARLVRHGQVAAQRPAVPPAPARAVAPTYLLD